MELNISRGELIRALSRVQGIVERRSTNRIIANVLLQARADNTLVVTATDTETSFVAAYEAQVVRAGAITVGARHLFDMARLMPTENVHLELGDGNQVTVESGASFFRINGLPASDFPDVPSFDEVKGLQVMARNLKELIEGTHFAISADDTRTGLNGTHVETRTGASGNQRVRFVATDGHRLSVCDRDYVGDVSIDREILLPKKGLAELRKLCDPPDELIGVGFRGNQVVFRIGKAVFSMRLLDGEFPDYSQVIPDRFQRRVVVNRQNLVDALRRVSILASEKSHSVRLAIQEKGLVVQSFHSEFGEGKEEITAVVQGEPIEMGFNARYLLEALGALSSEEEIAFEAGDHLSPCVVKPVEGDDALFIIMPMRLD